MGFGCSEVKVANMMPEAAAGFGFDWGNRLFCHVTLFILAGCRRSLGGEEETRVTMEAERLCNAKEESGEGIKGGDIRFLAGTNLRLVRLECIGAV